MSVVFDLDACLFNWSEPFAKLLEKMFMLKPIDLSLMDKWYWNHNIQYLSREDFNQAFNEFTSCHMYRELELLPGAWEAVEHFRKKYGKLYFMTQRPDEAILDTEISIAKSFPRLSHRDYTLVISSSKGKKCSEAGAEVAIEDGPHHATDIIVNNGGIHLYLKDMPFNRYMNNFEQLTRFNDLYELIKLDMDRTK